MTASEALPRAFGPYVLAARLGEDVLGRVYRALRVSGEGGFVRLRILESPELADDAILDAIEANGEVHGFLKNPAIARGVQMDSVEGTPYIAWTEESGRTLDTLAAKVRAVDQKVPIEHALLVAEKVATALDHAYNTAVDGERTLHGLVWPGFVLLSDDGEARLTGFGLAPGIFPSIEKPRFSREVGPYLAPEEREAKKVANNSDVYSVGALLFELLTGRPPAPADPLSDLRSASGGAEPIPPELAEVLRMCLAPADARYRSSGDLRRELGKLLFSGNYAPSTFNLAFFLNGLFREEIEAETLARAREASFDPAQLPRGVGASPPPATVLSQPPAPPAPAPAAPRREAPLVRSVGPPPRRRRPFAVIGALVVAAAVAGGIYVVARRPGGRTESAVTPAPMAVPAPSPAVAAVETPPGPTTEMTEAQFKEEVSRRLAQEVKKLEEEYQKEVRPTPELGQALPAPTPLPPVVEIPAAAPEESPPAETLVPAAPTMAPRPVATASPAPTRPMIREGDLVPVEQVDTPPRIQNIIKPIYPPLALQARIGGIVVLRVLVSETGAPIEIEVTRGAKAGLTESAVRAVRRWSFQPARKDGVAVRTWTTVPIPFEP